MEAKKKEKETKGDIIDCVKMIDEENDLWIIPIKVEFE